jgi:hypothetical protein
VIDPAANTKVAVSPFASRGDVAVVPTAILATAENRLEVEARGRRSVAAAQEDAILGGGSLRTVGTAIRLQQAVPQLAEPMAAAVRTAALKQVDDSLIATGLLDRQTGRISETTKKKFSFEATSSLPTPGLLVRGCIDDCDICEPARQKEIDLDLERKSLENQLLKRQIELLDKAQKYRCCPAGEEHGDDDDQ